MSRWCKLSLRPSLESVLLVYCLFQCHPLNPLFSSKIAQNVNADESFVLGSAFYGATLSRQFRTKKMKVQDISSYDFQISYETTARKGGKRSISTIVYPKGSKTGVKKTLTLKGRDSDFTMTVGYKAVEETPYGFRTFAFGLIMISRTGSSLRASSTSVSWVLQRPSPISPVEGRLTLW